MLPIKSLLKLEQDISEKLESDKQDDSRLDIISRLSIQGAFNEAESIIDNLNFHASKEEARNIIKENQNNLNQNFEEYLKHVRPQRKISQKLKINRTQIEEADDVQEYGDLLDYFMKTTDYSTPKRNIHIKELKSRTESQRVRYLKETGFLMDEKSTKEKIQENQIRKHHDDFYHDKLPESRDLEYQKKSLIIKGKALTQEQKLEKKGLEKQQSDIDFNRLIKRKELKEMKKDANLNQNKKPTIPKSDSFLGSVGNTFLRDIVCKWYNQGIQGSKGKKDIHKVESFMFFWISFNALYYATTEASSDEKSWKEFTKNDQVKATWESIKESSEVILFLEYLKIRKVYDKLGDHVQTGGIYNMRDNVPLIDWDFGDDLQKYIGVIYQIRNNLFHGGKIGDDSDIELIKKASESFLVFLEKIYGFND